MERLTQWFGTGADGIAGLDPEYEEKYTADELIDVLLNKLAAYEETGLEPEEIEAAQKAMRAARGKEKIMKPILFNTEMVRAILDGRKSVTRRVCKDGNEYTVPDMRYFSSEARTYAVHNYADKGHTDQMSTAECACPICPGDVLYVRETWTFDTGDDDEEGTGYFAYKADGADSPTGRWHPSIHMPKDAARLFLRVTDVRVERLQDISLYDVWDEGTPQMPGNLDSDGAVGHEDFAYLWDSTIPKDKLPIDGWDANPWVWVYRFERISKAEAQKGGEGNA